MPNHSLISHILSPIVYYVQVFPDTFWTCLDTHLQIVHTTKPKGDAYTIDELWRAIDVLLSDASTLVVSGSLNIGDLTKVSNTSEKSSPKRQMKREHNTYNSLAKKVDSILNLMAKSPSGSPNDSVMPSAYTDCRHFLLTIT
ncbi:hypothetical protein BDP27DRAFT_1429699 [Rhodocollybia butyracea]|uniref:Uncharacterized protein n=1 Tax=Rhodocollybia butyracea TaxID=206335 RepID=A0A9P5PCP3_9AGAR|nr:hypothetical protein BDP27DRAFT_1429699 [Rhodocollybia butyracea]